MDWKRIPSLAALRAFEAAARHQSFTKAAQELNVTQAAIAQHVRSLETDLSETLVVRQGRGIATTVIGRELAEHLQDGFTRIAEGIDDIRARTEARPLNITTTPAFAANWLMPRMGEFWARYPDIAVGIHPSNGLVDVRAEGFDLAIRYGAGVWPGLASEMLTSGDFWIVAHPDLLRDRAVTCVADAADLTWFFDPSMLERKALVEGEGVVLAEDHIKMLTSNALVMAAITAGHGVSIQPRSLVERNVARGELQKICELTQDTLGYYLVYVEGREPKGLRTLTNWLRKQAKEEAAIKP